MKLEGDHPVALPLEETARRIADPRALKSCTPGLESLEPRGPDQFDAVLEVKLPAVQGRFEGSLEYAERQPPERLRLRVRARGALGFVDGEVVLALAASGEASRVRYSADVQVGGQVARLGQRMISGISREMATQFFEALGRWDPQAPDQRVAPSAGRAALQVAGRSALRALGLRRDEAGASDPGAGEPTPPDGDARGKRGGSGGNPDPDS